ncbi:MAG: aldo/keto reductase [Gemmatimonadetes bacterium]|nr:aldo/keto reductase [Gemmatimonadota bacterium]MDA1103459.1 aldo/keto reductase [Gemmatimonadota bacterium]
MKLSRRDLLKLGAGAGLTAAVGGLEPIAAQFPGQAMQMKTIPSSGQQLPAIGIGTRNFRSQDAELSVYRETLATFHRLGGRLLDTSPNYGDSEDVVGGILRDLGIRDDLFVATKVDREDREGGIRRMEESFVKLGGDDFDLMQVHNLRGTEVQLETMKAWKDQGRFRHIGVTTSSENQYDAVEDVMRRHDLDFVQVDFALGNRSAGDRLIPFAHDRGMAVLVNLPFGRGRMFEAVGDRPLPEWAADIDAKTWAQVFLKYVMAQPGTVIPIPGTTKPHHAVDNVGSAMGRLPDARLRQEMEELMDTFMA